MKYITFAVPCYNSQDYLSKCVASLIAGGDDVEIIIVDDGSTDNTAAIADGWAERYPSAVKVIHKPNGGHGSGIMAGLGAATGLYYKVVDSDDWLDGEAYASLLSTIKDNCSRGEEVDLYITNFVYEHVNDGTRYISGYAKNFPQNRVFGWDEIKPLKLWKMLLMHSLVYNTQKLRQCGISLPEHTFYEDNLFAYAPLAHMQKLYYLNVDMYRYYIGRSDQTVTIDNLVSHYTDQITVMRRMLAAYSGEQLSSMCRPQRRQMYHTLHAVMCNTYFFTTAKDSPQRRRDFAEMFAELKSRDVALYRRIKRMPLLFMVDRLPWKLKGKVTTASYKFLCRHVKLGQL